MISVKSSKIKSGSTDPFCIYIKTPWPASPDKNKNMVYRYSTSRRRRDAFYRRAGAQRRTNIRLARAARYGAYSTGRMAYGGRNRIALRNARTGGLLGIEHKYLDTALTATALVAPTNATGAEFPPNTGGVNGCLTAPAQGDGPSNREGNKIVVDGLLLQGVIQVAAQVDQTAADLSCNVYIALVMDTQTNGAQLNSEDVFSNPGGTAVLATSPNRNMSYTQRFKVLKMKKMALRIPTLTYDGTNIEQTGFHTPFKLSWKGKMPVTFTTASTTADIANVTNNSIQVVAFCSNTTLAPSISYNARARFFG